MKKLFHHKYELRHEASKKDFKIVAFRTTGRQFHAHLEQHNYFELVHHTFFHPESNPCTYIDDYKYPLTDNCWVLFPPHCKHNIERTGADIVLINFSYEFIESIVEFLNIDVDTVYNPAIKLFADKTLAILNNLVSEIMTEYYKYTNYKENIRLKLLLSNFLYIFFTDGQKIRPENIKQLKITTIIDYIQHNYTDNLTLEFISNKFYISKYEICRKIKSATGLTFSEYLTQIRINHSRELLEDSQLSINEIASVIGYTTSSYYSATFKRVMGISPNKYRYNYLNK